jgi:tetratricopeptide (TPR) repeat protein
MREAIAKMIESPGSAFCPPSLKALCLLAICLAILQTPPACAQMNMSDYTMGTEDQTPPGELPVPQRMTGIGNAHIKITATPEAQMWFDQGLNLLHDFWDYESARAFEQAIRVDPQCAMCYWGLYKAESFYHSTAKGYAAPALASAMTLRNNVSSPERLYVEASGEGGPQEVLRLRKLVNENPKDTQARIFLASAVGGKEDVEILESVLKEEPDDSAANHYYIHALEGSPHPEQALHSAQILASLAPASGHMVHMPGHIFFRMGEYALAEQAFAASMQVDERYMRQQRVQPDNDWNYVHNLMYAIANLMEEGKLKEATALSLQLTGARGELESTLYVYSARDSISRLDPRLPVALRMANWRDVSVLLKGKPQLHGQPNLAFLARQLTVFAAGMQAVEARNLAKAEESSTRFDAELWRMSQQSQNTSMTQTMEANNSPGHSPKLQLMADALLEPLLSNLSVMSMELRASLLAAQGQMAAAKTVFLQAAQAEKALGYHEPPNYIRPVGETEAAAMMAIGSWAAAKTAYEATLVERPRSGLALYGIAMCNEKAGDSRAATKDYADFLAAWKDANPGLAQVRHAQSYLAEHRGTSGL